MGKLEGAKGRPSHTVYGRLVFRPHSLSTAQGEFYSDAQHGSLGDRHLGVPSGRPGDSVLRCQPADFGLGLSGAVDAAALVFAESKNRAELYPLLHLRRTA